MLRLISVILSVALGVAIAACGEESSSLSDSPEAATESVTDVQTSALPASESEPDNASDNASTDDAAPSPESSPDTQILSMGNFVSGEHPTQGTVRLIKNEGQRVIEIAENFQTDAGPDLFVILHRSNDVIGSTVPPAYPIQEGDYVAIAPLQQVSGFQQYSVPASLDLDEYQSVAIWCRQFNATFGAATLEK
jgi:hypothetical protein